MQTYTGAHTHAHVHTHTHTHTQVHIHTHVPEPMRKSTRTDFILVCPDLKSSPPTYT
jgi:hypothetical protein